LSSPLIHKRGRGSKTRVVNKFLSFHQKFEEHFAPS
jgi:hypothetical protein